MLQFMLEIEKHSNRKCNRDQNFFIYSKHTRWDFLCSDRSNLNLMRWSILVIVSFVVINNDKITIWLEKIIKVTWEIILMKMKISARWRHCSKILKTNLKTHISPLLNRHRGATQWFFYYDFVQLFIFALLDAYPWSTFICTYVLLLKLC